MFLNLPANYWERKLQKKRSLSAEYWTMNHTIFVAQTSNTLSSLLQTSEELHVQTA